LLKSDS